MAGAQVSAQSQQTSAVRVATADERGYFRLGDLRVGQYTLEVRQAGFSPYLEKDVTVNLGGTVRADARLLPAAQAQQITVNAQANTLQPADTSLTNSVGPERIEESPVRTRNALDFVLMEPNLVPTGSAATTSASAGSGGSGFSVGGMRPGSNRIAIDALENNDEFSGGSRTELSPEIVQEFQVVNNGMSAEFGGASGGAVNVVTRSGTNTSHGDAFVFLQNGELNARPPVENAATAPDLSRYRVGAANGGALIRNKTFITPLWNRNTSDLSRLPMWSPRLYRPSTQP